MSVENEEECCKITLSVKFPCQQSIICSYCSEPLILQTQRGHWQFQEPTGVGLFDCNCCFAYEMRTGKIYHNKCAEMQFRACLDHVGWNLENDYRGMYYQCICVHKRQNGHNIKSARK